MYCRLLANVGTALLTVEILEIALLIIGILETALLLSVMW
jgi:hypothetical protein